MCWCRSSFDPHAAFASFMCHTNTFPAADLRIDLRKPSPHNPRHSRCHNPPHAYGTYRGTPPPAHAPAASPATRPTCSKLPPSEYSDPAVFSSKILKSQLGQSIPSSARCIPSAARSSPCSRVMPRHEPGCSTRYSAPIASARSTSPWNAAMDFSRTLIGLTRKIHQVAGMNHRRSNAIFCPQQLHLRAVVG